jgi:hypothetical protein
MFVLVTILALAAFVVREQVRLSNARNRYDWMLTRWNAGVIVPEELIQESESLMRAEMASPWISRESAQGKHALRMMKLLAFLDSLSNELPPGRTEEVRHKIVWGARPEPE